MSLDIDKLKAAQDGIDARAKEEIYNELPDSLISLIRNPILNYCLHEVKSAKKEEFSARVLNNWETQGIVNVESGDKGRVRRFNRLESVWLSIVTDARKFGLPLETLKQSRKELFSSPVPDFSIIKFCVLETILHKPKILAIDEEGHTRQFSSDLYKSIMIRGIFPMHLSFSFHEILKKVFPENELDKDFKINNAFSDSSKLQMLYFLKTGDFREIRLTLNHSDVRLIRSPRAILDNKDLGRSISNWNFTEAEIVIDNHKVLIIKPTP